MIHPIERLTLLLIVSVILIGGCSGCEESRIAHQVIGIKPADDYQDQSQFGPVKANAREPVELPPFPELSFAALIERFEADVAANRGDPEVLARKKQVIDNPELLWNTGTWGTPITVPKLFFPDHDPTGNPSRPDDIRFVPISEKGQSIVLEEDQNGEPKYLYLGKVFYLSEDQQVRIDAIPKTLPYEEKLQKRYGIMLEGINSFTAAKYLFSRGKQVKQSIGIEYAERAIQDYPDSVEAMWIWVNCHPADQRFPAYKEMLATFPNYAGGHNVIAQYYVYELHQPELAIEHAQKSMLLDSRSDGHLLGYIYYLLDEWEKAIIMFQGLSHIDISHETYLWGAQKQYREQRN